MQTAPLLPKRVQFREKATRLENSGVRQEGYNHLLILGTPVHVICSFKWSGNDRIAVLWACRIGLYWKSTGTVFFKEARLDGNWNPEKRLCDRKLVGY